MSDRRSFVKACQAAGLKYDPWHKHPRIVDPKTMRYVVISNTPGCPHAYKNAVRDIKKRLGIEVTL